MVEFAGVQKDTVILVYQQWQRTYSTGKSDIYTELQEPFASLKAACESRSLRIQAGVAATR